MPRTLLFLLIGLSCGWIPGWTQGFEMYNGRNHPELDWRVAETEHFKIAYPAHLQGIETKAAAVAEATYAMLSENLQVTFEEKIRIYLSDEDEIANGFAVPIGQGYTNIWVNVNEFAQIWTGPEKWLRKVIAHELTHIFHYQAVRTNVSLFAYLISNPLPRFWAEGLAQYQTETWDAQRGDRWLRTAVLEDRLSYNDGTSVWNGRLLYAVGNAQVRFFAEQYGDSALVALLKHRVNLPFGFKVHNFERAFEATTGTSYRDFYDRWRQHVNIYYNTLAGQMESGDSLGTEPLAVPGQYLYDVQESPDGLWRAVLSLSSLDRPVRQLRVVPLDSTRLDELKTIAEGQIHAPFAWHPNSGQLAFSRQLRGQYGSQLNDLFLADVHTGKTRRLTRNRRATSPTFAPDGIHVAFIGVAGGTANVFILNTETGEEKQATFFTGDVQLLSIRWHPNDARLVLSRFSAEGKRDLVLLNLNDGTLTPLTDGAHDARWPVWHPEGTHIAFTQFEENVPNAYTMAVHRSGVTPARITNLVTGATTHDWRPALKSGLSDELLVISGASKRFDHAFSVAANRRADTPSPIIPPGYTAWTTHRPSRELPARINPDSTLIQARYGYDSFKNLTHIISYPFPYYYKPDDWGFGGVTLWTEPLGKHILGAATTLAVSDPVNKSRFLLVYINNQFKPRLVLQIQRLPSSASFYANRLLIENQTAFKLSAAFPLDVSTNPYVSARFSARLQISFREPLNPDNFENLPDNLPPPEAGQQSQLRVALRWTKRTPYRYNVVHPLDGIGFRSTLSISERVLGGETRFLRPDVAAYFITPAPFGGRFFFFGRAQALFGDPLNQNVIGFSRIDTPKITPVEISFNSLVTRERVRGYRENVIGNRVLFGSFEYRFMIAPDLHTRLFGTVELGATALALFVDAGAVWRDGNRLTDQLGVGLELKNALRIAGFEFTHAIGIAQPARDLGRSTYDLYYRIRAALPF